ncbi:MAG: TIGR04076 family protein [Anaerolineales bacterium]|nr:TIGR04076 family protein [Anaerolineales bacterium]
MADVKITVLRKMENKNLAEEFCLAEIPIPCPHMDEGQEFLVKENKQPEGFCSSAWQDIHKSFLFIRQGGNFKGWMKDEDTFITCCTDGLRPVVFEIRRLSD